MLFNSYEFLIFFPIVVFVYFIIPKKIRCVWLLIASYYFYMSWNPKYAVLIGLSTLVTWLCGIFVEKAGDNIARKKGVMAASLIVNFGILFFFKYFDFCLQNINAVLNRVGVTAVSNPFDIILPVGISFYTFQAVGYTIDVYRGDVKAEHNFLRYALFVSFFPQLVAGPIERSRNLLAEVQELPTKKLWNYDRVTGGLVMMLYGMFMKLVVADRVTLLVDTVFGSISVYGSLALIAAAFGFSLQIYCDFAGYSTIAIGAARVMGFDLMENFDTPYFATSIKDFWRRWHISLSTWFRDYLYIPLGGNRKGKVRKYVNIMITFLVSGLWHGAAWHYVVWGGIHGGYQIVGELLAKPRAFLCEKLHMRPESESFKWGQIFCTTCLTTAAWVFFRANSIGDAVLFFKRLLTTFELYNLVDNTLLNLGLNSLEWHILLIAVGVMFLVGLLKYLKHETLDVFLARQALWFRWLVIFGLLFYILIYGMYGPAYDAQSFIYFQF